MSENQIDLTNVSVQTVEGRAKVQPKENDLSLENLKKLEAEISTSLETLDPAWFLTEETKKTRERYLALSVVSVLFLLTNPTTQQIELTWPVAVILNLTSRWPLDLSLIFFCTGIGANYFISARSELAQHTYRWNMAVDNSKLLEQDISDFATSSRELIDSKPKDKAFAPEDVKRRLKRIEAKAIVMKTNFDDLAAKNERIAKWGNRMPYLTFAIPLTMILAAFALRYTEKYF